MLRECDCQLALHCSLSAGYLCIKACCTNLVAKQLSTVHCLLATCASTPAAQNLLPISSELLTTCWLLVHQCMLRECCCQLAVYCSSSTSCLCIDACSHPGLLICILLTMSGKPTYAAVCCSVCIPPVSDQGVL